MQPLDHLTVGIKEAIMGAVECSVHFHSGSSQGYYLIFSTYVSAIVKHCDKSQCSMTLVILAVWWSSISSLGL